jgi:hypothetical protein
MAGSRSRLPRMRATPHVVSKNPIRKRSSTARRLSSSCATPAAMLATDGRDTPSSIQHYLGHRSILEIVACSLPRPPWGLCDDFASATLAWTVVSGIVIAVPPSGGEVGMGISDGEEHRALLEECRHGTRGGAVAGARDGWLKRERGLSSALPLPAYTRWMGQRCHLLAPGGAADPMEAFRRDSPSQEMTGVARRLAPICCLGCPPSHAYNEPVRRSSLR